MNGYRDLEVYKECRKLRISISKFAKTLPKQEDYLLKQQIVSSSRSVTACIAEGYGRYEYKDNYRFCVMAKGSLEETVEHLVTAVDEKYLTEKQFVQYENHCLLCNKLLRGYMKYIKNKKSNE